MSLFLRELQLFSDLHGGSKTLISEVSLCDHPVSEVCHRLTTKQAPFYLPVCLCSPTANRPCLAITSAIWCADNQWSTGDCFLIDSRYQGRSLINTHNIISKLSGSTPEWSHIRNVSLPITRLFTSRDVSTFVFSSEQTTVFRTCGPLER